MASPKHKPKNTKRDRKPWPNEVLGILLCGGGMLLLLSLISYSPLDLPNLPGLRGGESPEGGSVNWIGPVGAFLGYLLLMSFGAAAYLLPLTMIWMGVAKLAFDAPGPFMHFFFAFIIICRRVVHFPSIVRKIPLRFDNLWSENACMQQEELFS